ncbi:Protein Y67D8C.2 [Anopheles sinensis]|uniref:Protein Y67D8C.2 n=1 Tax=Anopheles sinensis TaxID=74873 RepID=A0A084VGC5_ANOSI|nr:Protein Y67D8C.2 [Anopheles sinensis]
MQGFSDVGSTTSSCRRVSSSDHGRRPGQTSANEKDLPSWDHFSLSSAPRPSPSWCSAGDVGDLFYGSSISKLSESARKWRQSEACFAHVVLHKAASSRGTNVIKASNGRAMAYTRLLALACQEWNADGTERGDHVA